MTEPLENVRVGMTGRNEVVVTRELTVGAHVDGMPFVYGTPMMILAMEIASGDGGRRRICRPAGRLSAARSMSAISRRRRWGARSWRPRGSSRSPAAACCSRSRRMTGRGKIGEGSHRRGAVNLESFAKRFGAG